MDLNLLKRPHTTLNERELLEALKTLEEQSENDQDLVIYLSRRWSELNPIKLRAFAKEESLEGALSKCLEKTQSILDSKLFLAWKNLVELDERVSLDLKTRKEIALQLLLQKRRIHIGDYLVALKGQLSRRQALRDLESFSFVHAEGKRKARRYSYVKGSC